MIKNLFRLLLIGGLAWLVYQNFIKQPAAGINSYQDCVKAGHPIQESYPERCAVPGGPTFTNPDAKPINY